MEAINQLPVGIITTLNSIPLLSNEDDVSSWLAAIRGAPTGTNRMEQGSSLAPDTAMGSVGGDTDTESGGQTCGRQLVSKLGSRSFLQRNARLDMWHQAAGTKEHQVSLLVLRVWPGCQTILV